MDHKDITIFLELVRCRNISKTAENLYLSQSAVSSRLKALEEEMGCQLVLRSKGQRSVELTRQGEEFISVAERWKLLLEETEAVKEKALSVVRIATNGSTYDRLLDEFLRQYTERHPEKKIQIKVCDSKDTYDLVSKELADFGFASYESLQGGLAVRCIDRQPLCIVRRAESPKPPHPISPSELDPEREVKTVYAEGLRECRKMLRIACTGKYDGYLLEGMACPGGCIAGAGTIQPPEKSRRVLDQYKASAPKGNPLESDYKDDLYLLHDHVDDWSYVGRH